MPSGLAEEKSLYSMTGYGEGKAERNGKAIDIVVRTYNHDGISVRVRGLEEDQSTAHKAEKFVKESFQRGRVEVKVKPEESVGLAPESLDLESIRKSFEGLSRLTEELGIPEGPALDDLVNLDLLETEAPYKGAWPTVKSALEEALRETREAQKEEGAAIKSDLMNYLEEIANLLSEAEERVPEVVSSYREDLKKRVEKLLGGGVELEEGELEKEIAMFADKVDVNEEISRARTHITTARNSLEEGGAVGKKLKFTFQELQREINTLGAKSKDGKIQSQVIDMKMALEKCKEQARNLG
ncbi:DUF1732 domain-containing protein [Candidatus Bipolaricaulota bacterium]|nr:DUF1732 domain-containing protein [Candidatus Bipolaricaulota bacterium]